MVWHGLASHCGQGLAHRCISFHSTRVCFEFCREAISAPLLLYINAFVGSFSTGKDIAQPDPSSVLISLCITTQPPEDQIIMANPQRALYIGIPPPPPFPMATVYRGIPTPPQVPPPRVPPTPPPSSRSIVQPALPQNNPALLTFKHTVFPPRAPHPKVVTATAAPPQPPPAVFPGTRPKSRWAFGLPPPPPTGRFSVFPRVPLAFPKCRPMPVIQPSPPQGPQGAGKASHNLENTQHRHPKLSHYNTQLAKRPRTK
jgi:hypothetical protein